MVMERMPESTYSSISFPSTVPEAAGTARLPSNSFTPAKYSSAGLVSGRRVQWLRERLPMRTISFFSLSKELISNSKSPPFAWYFFWSGVA